MRSLIKQEIILAVFALVVVCNHVGETWRSTHITEGDNGSAQNIERSNIMRTEDQSKTEEKHDTTEITDENDDQKREEISVDQERMAYLQGKMTFENSVMLDEWKERNKDNIKRNLNKQKSHVHARNMHSGMKVIKRNVKHSSRHGNKKRNMIDRELHVHGRPGALHVHTAKDETRLESNSGGMDVFIRNGKTSEKETQESLEKKSNENFHPLKVEYHIITRKRIEQGKGGNTKPCLVPPCSL